MRFFFLQVVSTTDHIDTEKLKAREQIKFFEEVLLFEDELHDHGVSSLSVKIVSVRVCTRHRPPPCVPVLFTFLTVLLPALLPIFPLGLMSGLTVGEIPQGTWPAPLPPTVHPCGVLELNLVGGFMKSFWSSLQAKFPYDWKC